MNRSHLRLTWLASVVTTALLALLLLSPVGIEAKPPGWGFTSIVAVPGTVSPDKAAAFDVTIQNTGRSNISSVLMTTDIDAGPLAVPLFTSDATWVNQDSDITRPCGDPPYTTALFCDFGSVTAGAKVSVRIAFRVPSTAGPYSFNFMLNGNGDTPSDSGGTSHGDTKFGEASVNVSSNDNFAGGFVVGGDTFSTGSSLSRQNPQSASVTTSDNLVPATVQESNSFGGSGDPCATADCIGQYATVTSPNPAGGPIKVSLLVLGRNIPGSVGPEDIVLFHVGGTDAERGDDGIIGDEDEERCDSATDSASAPCIFVTEEGQNFRIVAWLVHNGTLRGGF